MIESTKDRIWQAVIVTVVVSAVNYGAGYLRDQNQRVNDAPTQDWMLEKFATKTDIRGYSYDIQQIKKVNVAQSRELKELDTRQRGLTTSVQILCADGNKPCPIRNAMYRYPPIPPWPDAPRSVDLALHDKRRQAGAA